MAGLGIGALGLVVVPPCVTAWMVAFTAGVGGALLIGRHTVPFQHMLSILFTLGVAIFGVLDRRPLGVPPAQDQRRCRQPERKREPAAPGI